MRDYLKKGVVKMAYTSGCGMKALRELENFLDSKGISYFVKDTSDFRWPFRKPRILKDNLKYIVTVWAGKQGIKEWKFLAIYNEGIDKIDDDLRGMRAYPYIRNIQ